MVSDHSNPVPLICLFFKLFRLGIWLLCICMVLHYYYVWWFSIASWLILVVVDGSVALGGDAGQTRNSIGKIKELENKGI
jgi:hypothetical protein